MSIDAREQPPAGRIVLTYEDYCALPDDGKRYEIIEGELYVTPSPSRTHQEFAGNLLVVLKPFVSAHRLGVVYIAPFDVILEEISVVVPDLLFVVQDRVGIVTERGVRGAPDLIVEILSPGTARRDRVEKAKLYARHGVGHYWLADSGARILEVYELTEGQYRRSAGLADDDSFSPSLFPGLSIPLSSLWG
jgi:Uma2 family endonuclease